MGASGAEHTSGSLPLCDWRFGVRAIWPFALFSGVAFVVPYVIVAWTLGPEFPSLLGSLIALAIVVPAAKRGFLLGDGPVWTFANSDSWPPQWSGASTDAATHAGGPGGGMSLLRAWSPYLVAAILLVVTRISALPLPWLPETLMLIFSSPARGPIAESWKCNAARCGWKAMCTFWASGQMCALYWQPSTPSYSPP